MKKKSVILAILFTFLLIAAQEPVKAKKSPTPYQLDLRCATHFQTICTQPTRTVYFDLSSGWDIQIGDIIYTDSGHTTPLTGQAYIVADSGEVFSIDEDTGEVLQGQFFC